MSFVHAVDLVAPYLFVFLWSTGFIGARFGLPHAEPLTFLLVRYLVVICLMFTLAVAARAPWPRARLWGHIAVTGLLVHAVYLGGVFVAISRGLPAGITSLVVGLQPILTAVGAGAVLGERVAPRQWLGLALGFIGVAMVLSGRLAVAPPAAGLAAAVAAALVALLGITAGTLYQKRFCPAFDLRTGAVLQFVPAAIATAVAAAAVERFHVEWGPPFLFALSWLVLVLSLGAVSLLNLLIRRGSAVHVARLFFLVPPLTALLAFALFGERLRAVGLAGMGVAVTGVYLARAAAR